MKIKLMRHGALGIILALALFFPMIFWSGDALAIPIFQTYIQDATAGSNGQDQNTWFSTDNPFNLILVGAYNGNDLNGNVLKIEDMRSVTLLISVPQDQTGTILINSIALNSPILPDLSFLPPELIPSLHYPVDANASDFLTYDIGTFDQNTGLNDYNAQTAAETGEIPPFDSAAVGQEKVLTLAFSGFSQLHFDLYGLITTGEVNSDWMINPDSHDATALASAAAVPEPSPLLLLGSGLISLGLFGRRRLKDSKT